MRQPDFFVVGAAKSGTTALWKYFQKHPEIFVTKDIRNKELGYYSNQYGIKNKKRYLNFFKDAKPNQIIGEVCHVYLSSEESAEWIKSEVPNAKIIILLRNPVVRAYSLYNWMVMEGYENQNTFKKALKKEKLIIEGLFNESKLLHRFRQNYYYFNSGLYYKQVKRYYSEFGKENVLVIEYNDFHKNQIDTLQSIFKYLGVSTNNEFSINSVNTSNSVFSVKLQSFSRKMLLGKYRKKKTINSLFSSLMKLNTNKKTPIKLDNNLIMELMNKYVDDVIKLSQLTSINFYQKWYEEET